LRVVEAMKRDVAVVDVGVSVAEASKIMREKFQGCAVIMKKGKPVGMVTERDVTWKVAGECLDPRKVKVEEIMSTPLITIDPDSDLIEASRLMCKHRIRRLAVTRHDILYGVLTAADIARNLEGYVESEVRKIIRSAFFLSTDFR